jgi:molecular chaperone GrpE (heat shock protein)
VEEQNQELPIEPTVQARESSTSSAPFAHSTDAVRDEVPGSTALGDSNSLDALELMTSQINEQASLVKSTHRLVVDISGRITQMSDDVVLRAQRPLFLDLILFYDSLQQMKEWLGGNPAKSPEEVLFRLTDLESELLQVLARREVRPFEESPVTLDRRLHRTVKTVPTEDPAHNYRVQQIVRAGFFLQDKILRPEDVVISKYTQSLPTDGD